jgi:general L-amino acid transport system substrate-binding protein
MGVDSKNVDQMATNPTTPDMAHLLGKEGDFGKDLKLDNKWAYNIVKQVGNYSEIFENNVGANSPLKIKRGQNNLWNKGGIQYAPPVR